MSIHTTYILTYNIFIHMYISVYAYINVPHTDGFFLGIRPKGAPKRGDPTLNLERLEYRLGTAWGSLLAAAA